MKKNLLLPAFALALGILAGCDQKTQETPPEPTPAPIPTPTTPSQETQPPAQSGKVITHEQGSVHVAKAPSRIAVFDFGALDTMNALKVEGIAALPKKNLPGYLVEYAKTDIVNAGGMKQPDLQALGTLKPDLIIISGRQSKSFEALNGIAPTVNLSLDAKHYLGSIKKNVMTIGQIFNKEAEAENGLAVLDKKIADVRIKAESAHLKAMVLVHYNGKLSASNSNAYAAVVYQIVGLQHADEGLTDGRQAATPDYIAEKNPDVIFVVDRNEAIGEGKMDRALLEENEQIRQTGAFRKGKIVYLRPDLWYLSGGGLESLSLQLDEVSRAIQ
ncbi:iron ABC transporter substrate-binding protein [Leminorella grimontii]|uniref:Iron ABC transporter substrate-binding protein n=1 Tax=Leminorella grimontii TaxID=82981 RepID=A0AAV5N4P1_9GAMM|nr:ABC transporter substrate-binding protein [Leminorella grimontii]KFC97800.1 substrate-binding component of an ABC superfamily iron compound transporter [Leminorella grimontii ATCC 33999 = DSM 5078]GKX55367.1 iron ABC transporter substrate-binding protein [Leminorella grimontii]VFS56443.1 Uncharacterized ABC transporter solute-binding protein yclQ precursor [Leminorella grimontii]